EAANLNTLKEKIMNLVIGGATNPVILELDSEAKGSFQAIKQADNNKNEYSDQSFMVGKNFKLNDPAAIFEIIVRSRSRQNFNDNEQNELIRIIGKNLHDVITHKKYFLQLREFDEPTTSVTNRLRDAIAIWPKDKQSTSMNGSKEERLKTLRQKLRTPH
ncbi:MAG: hypothetical protein KGJ07_08550, partial [Patescibacteria group bacterium]|nr:hypothetical protein [Patescibacteria group bacterium]